MLYRPKAPQALVDGYYAAAELATRRAVQREDQGESREAEMWRRLAEYCTTMADTRSLDDDAYQRLKKGSRKELEPPMSHAIMAREEEKGNVSPIWETENQGIPEWKWAAMELAMSHLSVLQRICFEMKAAGGLTYRDIGEALNMSRDEVRSHTAKARKKLALKVGPIVESVFKKRGAQI